MFCMIAALQYQSCLHIVTLWGQDPNFGPLQLLYRWTAANSEHRFGNSAEFWVKGALAKVVQIKSPKKVGTPTRKYSTEQL